MPEILLKCAYNIWYIAEHSSLFILLNGNYSKRCGILIWMSICLRILVVKYIIWHCHYIFIKCSIILTTPRAIYCIHPKATTKIITVICLCYWKLKDLHEKSKNIFRKLVFPDFSEVFNSWRRVSASVALEIRVGSRLGSDFH